MALVWAAATVPATAADTARISAVFWRYNMPGQDAYYRDLVATFDRTHPGLHLDLHIESWDDAHNKLAQWAAGAPGPDIAVCPDVWMAEFAPALWAYPAALGSDFEARFHPQVLKRLQSGGHAMAVPWACSLKGLYVRKDLLQTAGLRPPQTWAELKDTARTLKRRFGIAGFALPGAPKADSADNFYFFLWTNGAELHSGGGTGLLGPRALEALRFYHELAGKDGVVQPRVTEDDRNNVERLFVEGKAAMVETGPWLIHAIRESAAPVSYAIYELPWKTNPATQLVSDQLVVFSKAANSQAVTAFLKFAYQTEWRRRWAQLGMVPVERAVIALPEFRNNPEWTPFLSQLPNARWLPPLSWEPVDRAIRENLVSVLKGEQVEGQALAEMNRSLEAAERARR